MLRATSVHSDSPIKFDGIKLTKEDPAKRFELLALLGRGSFGDQITSDICAIKMIAVEDEESLAEVKREVKILETCKHANVVQYYGAYEKNGALWIVMEYCGGGSVSDIMHALGHGLNEQQIAVICHEALNGLTYLHSQHRIHRDIKGGNILLTDSGEVKLADFGVSAQLNSTMSKRNSFIGTPYWMAPEVIQGLEYDGRSDIWSLGVTCIEMADTVPPNSNVHPMRVLLLIPKNPPPLPKDKSKWTDSFSNFLSSCLIKDPDARFPADVLANHHFVKNAKSRHILKDLVDQVRDVMEKTGYGFLNEDDDASEAFESSNNTAVSKASGTMIVLDDDGDSEYGTTVESGTVIRLDDDDGSYGTRVTHPEPSRTFQKESRSVSIIRESAPAPIPVDDRVDEILNGVNVRQLCIRMPLLAPTTLIPDALLSQDIGIERLRESLLLLCDNPGELTDEAISALPAGIGNLLETLSMYEDRQQNVLMNARELEANDKTLADLRAVIRTILRL